MAEIFGEINNPPHLKIIIKKQQWPLAFSKYKKSDNSEIVI